MTRVIFIDMLSQLSHNKFVDSLLLLTVCAAMKMHISADVPSMYMLYSELCTKLNPSIVKCCKQYYLMDWQMFRYWQTFRCEEWWNSLQGLRRVAIGSNHLARFFRSPLILLFDPTLTVPVPPSRNYRYWKKLLKTVRTNWLQPWLSEVKNFVHSSLRKAWHDRGF